MKTIGQRTGHAEWLLKATDFGLAGVIFVAPLFMGGRHPLGRLVLVLLVALTSLSWLLHQYAAGRGKWRRCGAEWLLLAGLAILVVQLLPLPAALLHTISPAIAEHLPLWSADGPAQFGTWSTLSLYPASTRSALVIYLAYAMLFSIVLQRIETIRDLQRLLVWIAGSASFMAAIGLLQFIAGNGKFLWIYAHPERDTYGALKGAFQNQNHMAHFLALGVGPLVWSLQHVLRRGEGHGRSFAAGSNYSRVQNLLHFAPMVGLALVGFAGLLTFSRGGILALAIAASISVALLVKMALLGRKSLLAVAGVGLMMVAALVIHGYEPLLRELETVRAGSLRDLDQGGSRLLLWSAALDAAGDYPLVGTGAGSHEQVYRTYLDEDLVEHNYSHAESGYLQVLEETGLTGMLLLLAGVGLCGWWCYRAVTTAAGVEHLACTAAVAAGLAASALHSLFDFVWYIPACMSTALVLAAGACRLHQWGLAEQSAAEPVFAVPRPVWIGAALAVALLGAFSVCHQVPAVRAARHWDNYLAMSLATSERHLRGLAAELGKIDGTAPDQTAVVLAHLEQVVQRNPQDARAHLRLASVALRRFEHLQRTAPNAMPLNQIREAALASRFASREAQDHWLQVAIGQNRRLLYLALAHLRRALELCPLQGSGYALLSDLTFLDGFDARQALVNQALKVRPYSPPVLLQAGAEMMRASVQPGIQPEMTQQRAKMVEQGLWCWKRAFRKEPSARSFILGVIIFITPVEVILSDWPLDEAALYELFVLYQKHLMVREAQQVAPHLIAALEKHAATDRPEAAGILWLKMANIHSAMGQEQRAVECLRQAVAHAPDNFEAQYLLGQKALQLGQYTEAAEALQWCLYRKPGHSGLRDELAKAKRLELDMRQSRQPGSGTELR